MHRAEYGHTIGSLSVIFGAFVTVVTFGIPVTLWYTRDRISI